MQCIVYAYLTFLLISDSNKMKILSLSVAVETMDRQVTETVLTSQFQITSSLN